MNCEKCGNSVKLTDHFCQKCGADLQAQKGTSANTSVFRNLDLSSYGKSDADQEHSETKIFINRQDFFRYPSDAYVAKNVKTHKILAWIYIISCAINLVMMIVKTAQAANFINYWYGANESSGIVVTGIIYSIAMAADIVLCAIGLNTKHFGVHIPLVLLTSNIYEYLFPGKLVGLSVICWIISLVHVIVLLVLSIKLTNSYTRYSVEIHAKKD